jgi:hypothetical protein
MPMLRASRLFLRSTAVSIPASLNRFAVNARMMASLRDPNTLSNYDQFITSHITANFDIDFDKKHLSGNVILKLKSLTDDGTKVIKLDSRYAKLYRCCPSTMIADQKFIDASYKNQGTRS